MITTHTRESLITFEDRIRQASMSKRFKISTPDADEYREVIFEVHFGMVVGSTPAGFEHFHGRKWEDVDRNFWSAWKLWSTPCKDNVYPNTEELSPVSKLSHTKESLIAFEEKIRLAWEAGELPSLIHLCGGNENDLLKIFADIRPQDWIFVSHRAHYHALLKGMPEDELEMRIRSDRSMFIFDRERRIYQSAILGGCCGVAVGVARAIRDSGEDAKAYCFLGDGASDNGHLYEAVLYATGHDLPVTFIVENNNKQVDTDILTRRGPNHWQTELTSPKLREYLYEPRWPHAGSGCSHQITFQRTYPL